MCALDIGLNFFLTSKKGRFFKKLYSPWQEENGTTITINFLAFKTVSANCDNSMALFLFQEKNSRRLRPMGLPHHAHRNYIRGVTLFFPQAQKAHYNSIVPGAAVWEFQVLQLSLGRLVQSANINDLPHLVMTISV